MSILGKSQIKTRRTFIRLAFLSYTVVEEIFLTQCKEEICIVTVVKGQKELASDRKLMENFKDLCTIYNLHKE